MGLFNRKYLKKKTLGNNLIDETTSEDNKKGKEILASIVFFDVETDSDGKKVFDIGAISDKNDEFHSNNQADFSVFINKADYICGHNIFEHDLKYIKDALTQISPKRYIDTLYLSPLLFPLRPYHKLGKQYKIVSEEEQNNPLLDSKLARDLFNDEIVAFDKLDNKLKNIFFALLNEKKEFSDFFKYIGFHFNSSCIGEIKSFFKGKICENTDIEKQINENPIELAYTLALINAGDKYSITPPWVLKKYPRVENVMYILRSKRCLKGCTYCDENINLQKALKRLFGFSNFKTYEGEPLQEKAAEAAIDGKSLLAIFPTGGGKSITFQLPALVQGEALNGLSVIISPLQSLMKDQVDNLEKKGITDAVTINGALDPIERAKAFERVEDGSATILYLSPESLRSKSIETLLLKRNVVRFIIDEAHCFSSWGQDFRVDYLYIGDFIKEYQEKKSLSDGIPVSCFTATAKQKVIEDIQKYFKEKLSLELFVFKTGAQRTNLSYFVFNKNSSDEKYLQLRDLLESHVGPTIVYVSRTKKAQDIAERLNNDGIEGGAVYYHGQMDREERIKNQEKFMLGESRIIVATTAFGMGVDKNNVGTVIHYDISTSLEDYVQEAGRAGRDENIKAKCFVLFDEEDLNKHFILLNQTKLSIKEIQQVWKAIKEITKFRDSASKSALEIARQAGWDDTIADIETRVRTAISALEESGFLRRGQNMPRIFANSILSKNAQEAIERINTSRFFSSDKERENAIRIIKSLISSKSRSKVGSEEGEARVDYISDKLGIPKEEVIRVVNTLREERILSDAKDLTAFIKRNGRVNASLSIISEYSQIENEIIKTLSETEQRINLKELNKNCEITVPTVNINKIKTIINLCAIKGWIKRKQSDEKDVLNIISNYPIEEVLRKIKKREELSVFITKYLFEKSASIQDESTKEEIDVEFSCLELKEQYEKGDFLGNKTSFEEIDDVLYYLTKTGAARLEGAFLVSYNAMRIERKEQNTRRQYKIEDYKKMEDFYNNKIQQIHIVGEYAKKLTSDYQGAIQFVDDYFKLNYDGFLRKYFKGRETEITKNITPQKFKQLFGDLSPRQLSIIKDSDSKYIVVAAGPGSGKTKVLVHKLASLYMMEDVKHEQMLMLTFSRSAATEFKKRLMSPTMLGSSANFIQINTFHAYCFDLLGRVGSLEDSTTIVKEAVNRIRTGEIEINKVTKTVLVIDEAQDMSETEYSLVQALMETNEEMRIIAVGDDDQNIYEFRNSDSKYLKSLITEYNATKYELLDNYRSRKNIVALANSFAGKITNRLKTTPINSTQKIDGEVSITKYTMPNLCVPVVNKILSASLSGTTCVLTETNDEAATIAGLLTRNGIEARLIQENSGFKLSELDEIRYFVDALRLRNDIFTIDKDAWKLAKELTCREYSQSSAYEYIENLIKDYEETNPETTKYKTDFLQFINESKLEDFCSNKNSRILVSTIHKAKGREFDNVYFVLKQNPATDDKKRAVYVALTRAKNNLSIHCNVDCFDGLRIDGVTKKLDENQYQEPAEIVIPISHNGVTLSAFYFYRNDITKLRSGDSLEIKKELVDYSDGRKADKYFCYSNDGKRVVQFSESTCKRIEEMIAKGYLPKYAVIRNIVWWKQKEKDGKELPECKIILPDILFAKETN